MKYFCFFAALAAGNPISTTLRNNNLERVTESISGAISKVIESKPKRFHFTGLEQIEAYRRNGRAIFSKSGSKSSGSGRIHAEEFSQGLSVPPPSSSVASSLVHHRDNIHAARGPESIYGMTHNTFGSSSTISDNSVKRHGFLKPQGIWRSLLDEFNYPIWFRTKSEKYLYDLQKSKGADVTNNAVISKIKNTAYKHDYKIAKAATNVLDLNARESVNPKITEALDAYNAAAHVRLSFQTRLLGREMTLTERKIVNVAANIQHLPQTDLVTASQLQIRIHANLFGKYPKIRLIKLEELLAIEFNAAKRLRILRREFKRAFQRALLLKHTII